MLRSCLTWAPVSAMGSRFLCMGRPRRGLNLRELSHDSAGTARCGARLPSSQRMRMPGEWAARAANRLRAGRRDRLPCNKRPTNLTDMVEHVASLRHTLGARLTGMGILDHVLGDVVAQAVDLVLVAVLEHARKVCHACLETIEGVAAGDSKYVTCGSAPI